MDKIDSLLISSSAAAVGKSGRNVRKTHWEVAGKLPGQLESELAVGMKAMVTMNIATEADLANRARGKIVDIVLNPIQYLIENLV